MAQVVIFGPIIAHPRVRSRASPCETCHGNGTGFPPHTSVFLPSESFYKCSTHHHLNATQKGTQAKPGCLDSKLFCMSGGTGHTTVFTYFLSDITESNSFTFFCLIYATESRDRSTFSYPGAIFKLPSTRQTAKGPVSLEVQLFTGLEYQMSSPHCPDRNTNAHAGTSECGHLWKFHITVRGNKII